MEERVLVAVVSLQAWEMGSHVQKPSRKYKYSTYCTFDLAGSMDRPDLQSVYVYPDPEISVPLRPMKTAECALVMSNTHGEQD